MSDKLRQGISVTPEFTEGESPSPAKFNAISQQMRAASEQLEKAVGDVHSQSWPYSAASLTTLSMKYAKSKGGGNELSGTAERYLDIANVARLIGPASNLNPRMLGGSTSITESVPIGVHEFRLKYSPSNQPTFSDGVVFATLVGINTDLANAGEYSTSGTGIVWVVTITAGGTVTYNTNSNNKGGGMIPARHRHNVIPDPNQISAGGIGLTWSAPDAFGRRTATTPSITHAQSNHAGNSITLDDTENIYNRQITLPKVLVDNFIAGDQIPSGFLFVKNNTTGEVYEDAEYFFNTNSTVLVGNVDLTADIDAGHSFSILTVGSDITSSIDDLRRKLYHKHDGNFGEPLISAADLVGWHDDAPPSGIYMPSEITGNFASQYMHRDGFSPSGENDNNLNDKNCMRGALMMGRSGGAPGTYTTHDSTTFPIQFGSTSRDMKWISTSKTIQLQNNAADSFIKLSATGETGGLILNAHTSSGTIVASGSNITLTSNSSGFVTAAGGPMSSQEGFMGEFDPRDETIVSPTLSPYVFDTTCEVLASGTRWLDGPTQYPAGSNIAAKDILGWTIVIDLKNDGVLYPPSETAGIAYYTFLNAAKQLKIVFTSVAAPGGAGMVCRVCMFYAP